MVVKKVSPLTINKTSKKLNDFIATYHTVHKDLKKTIADAIHTEVKKLIRQFGYETIDKKNTREKLDKSSTPLSFANQMVKLKNVKVKNVKIKRTTSRLRQLMKKYHKAPSISIASEIYKELSKAHKYFGYHTLMDKDRVKKLIDMIKDPVELANKTATRRKDVLEDLGLFLRTAGKSDDVRVSKLHNIDDIEKNTEGGLMGFFNKLDLNNFSYLLTTWNSNGDTVHFMINPDNISRLVRLMEHGEISEEDVNSDTNIVQAVMYNKNFRLTVIEKKRPKVEGGFFPYLMKYDNYDLSRWGIYCAVPDGELKHGIDRYDHAQNNSDEN